MNEGKRERERERLCVRNDRASTESRLLERDSAARTPKPINISSRKSAVVPSQPFLSSLPLLSFSSSDRASKTTEAKFSQTKRRILFDSFSILPDKNRRIFFNKIEKREENGRRFLKLRYNWLG